MLSVKHILIIILVILIPAAITSGYFLNKLNRKTVACTMEAKLCPDGSYVGRTGPNCEFSACPAPPTSGIKGAVLLGPACPVIKNPPDEKCADKLYKTALIVTTTDQLQTIKQFSSDDGGKFSVSLSPGEYNIISAPSQNIFPRCSNRDAIKVVEGQYTDTTIYCDTGIR